MEKQILYRKYSGPALCGVCSKRIEPWKKYCSIICRNKSYIGRKQSLETKEKRSKSMKGFRPVNMFQPGEKHPFWNNDRGKIQFVDTPEYRELRIRVLKRDNFSCQLCGIRGEKGIRPILNVHHIKPRKSFPELSLIESNCIVLCLECHKKTDTYLNRWQDYSGKKADLINGKARTKA